MFLLAFLLAWVIIFIFLKFFEILSSGKLSRILNKRNVTVKFGYVSIHTTKYNRRIELIANRRRSLFRKWFTCGAILGFFGLIISVYLLISNISQLCFPPSTASSSPPQPATVPSPVPKFERNSSEYMQSETQNQQPSQHLFAEQGGYARIPFFKKSPSIIPYSIWKLFTPTDHNLQSVVLNSNGSTLYDYVAKLNILSWHHGIGDEYLPDGVTDNMKDPPCGGRTRHEIYREVTGSFYAVNNRALRELNRKYRIRRLMHKRQRHMILLRKELRKRRLGLLVNDNFGPAGHFGHPPPPPPFPPHDHRNGNHPPPPPRFGPPLFGPPLFRPPLRHRQRKGRHLNSISETSVDNNTSNISLFNSSLYLSIPIAINQQNHYRRRRIQSVPPPLPPIPPPPSLGDKSRSIPGVNNENGKGDVNERNENGKETSRENENKYDSENENDNQVSKKSITVNPGLTPLVPGVTVPTGDIWYMILAMLIAAIVHEVGHALAAAAENGEVSSLGAFVAVLIPGAYARLHGIEDMNPKSQLRVYCAGAFHNVMSAILSIILLMLLPHLVLPIFHNHGKGALVVDIPPVSPLFGNLKQGDIILKMGNSQVLDGGPNFRSTIEDLHYSNYTVGFCIDHQTLRESERVKSKCCSNYKLGSNAGIPNNNKQVEKEEMSEEHIKDDSECYKVMSLMKRYVCLNPNNIQFNQTCQRSIDCRSMKNKNNNSKQRFQCIVPILDENKQLIDIVVKSKRNSSSPSSSSIIHFFYEGYPIILGTSVTVSSYIPRAWDYLPERLLRYTSQFDIPNLMERFLQYFASISLGLAIMNMAPVLYLDGEASVGLFVRVLFKKWPLKRVKRIRALVLSLGSLLLLINLVLSLLFLEK